MGVSAQSLTGRRPASSGSRAGLAVPAALFAIVLLTVLATGAFVMSDLNAKSSRNREDWARATHLAESGMNHALAVVRENLGDTTMTRLIRGFDGTKNTSDDGLLVGYGLTSDLAIPATGFVTTGGKYYVRLTDDPAETDGDPKTDRNTRLLATCRGVTDDGATVTINAVVGNASIAGLAVNGDFEISGTTQIRGRCGSVHTNGDMKLGTTLVVETNASSSGTTTGTIKNTYGETLPEQEGADPVEFPAITAASLCGRADYMLRSNGTVLHLPTNTVVTKASVGWSGGPTTWEPTLTVVEATYCVEGNVKISSDIGTAANPRNVSLIVKGSMEISGNPFFEPDDPQGIMWVMDGDLKLNGNSTTNADSFNGFIYAGAQCEMSGTVRIGGQVVCANNANPAGSENWVAENKISGTTTITYGCNGYLSQLWRVLSWYPTIGS